MSLQKAVDIIDEILDFLEEYEYEHWHVDLSKCEDSNSKHTTLHVSRNFPIC